MTDWKRYAAFDGPIVIVGFGSIAQGTLPLLLRHIEAPKDNITILCPDDSGKAIAEENCIRFRQVALTRDNLRSELEPLLAGKGGFIVNLSVDVSSMALIALAREWGTLYIDTCIEPWPGGYTDPTKSPTERSNYGLREEALAFRRDNPGGPTAVVAHGANPGLVSHFVKDALLALACDAGVDAGEPKSRDDWGRLAQRLGVKGVHIAERDTQVAEYPKARGEFVNTWSVDGFISEGLQPAELGWGTHEKDLPRGGNRHPYGCDAAIYLNRPGAGTRVRTWTPLEGPFHGWLITHNEAISIADYFTVHDGDQVVYRPTVHYAYHPCDDAVLSLHEMAGKNWEAQSRFRLMNDEIASGMDELGVLLYGHARNAYWYGSRLTIEEARRLAPYQNATGLQVSAAVLAGMVWAIENPGRGLTEADELDHRRIMELARPYLGEMAGVYTEWTPLDGREKLFPEDLDREDPWQFRNVIVR